MVTPSYRITYHLEGLALFDAESLNPKRAAERAAWVREIGLLLGIAESTIEGIEALAEEAARSLEGERVWVDPWRFKGYSPQAREDVVRRILVSKLRGRASLGKGGKVLRVFITEGVAIAGIILASRGKGFHLRRPRRRPFFKPGPLSPDLSRVLVNLSRPREGSTFLDPFCGTGGFAIEAMMVGAGRIICGDLDRAMYRGSRVNLDTFTCGRCLVIAHNAAKLPIGSGVVDSIATDPPYGRSTTTARMGYRRLMEGFLSAALEALAPGGYIVYAGPHSEEPASLGEDAGLQVLARMHMYVHSSLTREVVVARRP